MAMAHSPFIIANVFLGKGLQEGWPITPMKLNKLIYIAHGVTLAVTDQPLIDEHIQAWKYGPVIGSIYHKFKNFGNNSITELAPVTEPSSLTEDQNFIVTSVWNKYKPIDPIALSALTHQAGTPWDEYWNLQKNTIIPNEAIKNYYKSFLNEQ